MKFISQVHIILCIYVCVCIGGAKSKGSIIIQCVKKQRPWFHVNSCTEQVPIFVITGIGGAISI